MIANETEGVAGTQSAQAAVAAPIERPYLQVSHIEIYRQPNGRLYIRYLWLRDLEEHLTYLRQFILACPCFDEAPPEGFVPLDTSPAMSKVRLILLPGARSFWRALLQLPRTISRLWPAVRTAEIVHSGVVGWPIPTAWIVTPLARMLGRTDVIVVESAPWRIPPNVHANVKRRLLAWIYERFARLCLRNARLTIFTQDEYRRSLLGRTYVRGHVIHASWIDDTTILTDEEAQLAWRKKSESSSVPLKVLFAGQLKHAKGITVLLAAIRQLDIAGLPIELDILGAGDLRGDCEGAARELHEVTKVRTLGTVSYGPDFFALLRNYHAVVVPSISDEQPRIVYDAYSQAVPVLASRTPGLIDCVKHERTGWLVQPNDATALAGLLRLAAARPDELRKMGLEALKSARGMTHRRMHRERHLLLGRLIAPGQR